MPLRHTFLAIAAGVLILAAAPAMSDDDTWSVTLENGDQHQGELIRLLAGRYLLLSDDGTMFELTDDDIDPTTFSLRPANDARPRRKISVTNTYVELGFDGTSKTYVDFQHLNTSNRVITEYKYGLAPWEQLEIDNTELIDQYGTRLHREYDPPREKWNPLWDKRVQVTARLPVPVAPGELWTTTYTHKQIAGIERTEEGLVYEHWGDYPEDRLVWYKLRLPQGAKLVRADPEPSATFDDAGFTYVMWRQFYRKGERRALTAVYGAPR